MEPQILDSHDVFYILKSCKQDNNEIENGFEIKQFASRTDPEVSVDQA